MASVLDGVANATSRSLLCWFPSPGQAYFLGFFHSTSPPPAGDTALLPLDWSTTWGTSGGRQLPPSHPLEVARGPPAYFSVGTSV